MSDSPIRGRIFAWTVAVAVTTGAIGFFGWQHVAPRFISYDASNHTYAQNFANLGATDVCEMLPLEQFGSPIDDVGNRIAPTMTVYLQAPEGRRPKTGDVIEIKYPEELEGRLLFTQSASDGYGGSGLLNWLDQQRDARLALAIWDSTRSGSLQYSLGDVQLWGDCKKAHEIEVRN
ncbi:hypothetical protein [Altererythrobacter sp.]|uniref:hypothetical protein n=1 Tax=Altererythrobacter sp. TaxID=1872480 RepID=UPI003CFE6816